jgi:hypothetical protein
MGGRATDPMRVVTGRSEFAMAVLIAMRIDRMVVAARGGGIVAVSDGIVVAVVGPVIVATPIRIVVPTGVGGADQSVAIGG